MSFTFLDNFLKEAYIIFRKRVLIILKRAQNMPAYGNLGCCTPLKIPCDLQTLNGNVEKSLFQAKNTGDFDLAAFE